MRDGSAASPDAAAGERASVLSTDVELAKGVEDVAERLVQADEFSGVVLLSRHGQPLLRRAFGLADRERARPNRVDTPFALASVSKMFTAVVVAQLVERNRLSFDATIRSVLPTYPAGETSSQVTVGHLLTMSSGIPDLFQSPQFWAGLDRIKTLSDFWPYFAKAPLQFPPGSKWAYSNSNFLVLGAIVERVFGRPFAAVVEAQVFGPAGMTRTGYDSSPFPDAARGYTRTRPSTEPGAPRATNVWRPAWEEPSAENRTGGDGRDDFVVGAPMGGGMSTADDLARFAEALMHGRLLGRAMTQRVFTGYVPADHGGHAGYGFETRLVNGVRTAGHRGGFSGIANQVELYPDLGYVLVVLGNSDANGTETIANHVRTAIVAAGGNR
jgi:CubicO group peptidase (beta-lactamase class C family)